MCPAAGLELGPGHETAPCSAQGTTFQSVQTGLGWWLTCRVGVQYGHYRSYTLALALELQSEL